MAESEDMTGGSSSSVGFSSALFSDEDEDPRKKRRKNLSGMAIKASASPVKKKKGKTSRTPVGTKAPKKGKYSVTTPVTLTAIDHKKSKRDGPIIMPGETIHSVMATADHETIDLERVKVILKKYPTEVTSFDQHKNNPLHVAALKPDVKCLKLLLPKIQARQLKQRNNQGNTPFMCAAMVSSDPACVKLLLNHKPKPDLNLKNIWGRTPLIHACFSGLDEIATLIINAKPPPDFDIADKSKKPAIYWALNRGNVTIARALLEAGASLKFRDSGGRGPADIVEGQPCIDLLAEYGIEVTAKSSGGGGRKKKKKSPGLTESKTDAATDRSPSPGPKKKKKTASAAQRSGHSRAPSILRRHSAEFGRTSAKKALDSKKNRVSIGTRGAKKPRVTKDDARAVSSGRTTRKKTKKGGGSSKKTSDLDRVILMPDENTLTTLKVKDEPIDVRKLRTLLDRFPLVEIELRDGNKNTPLHLAAQYPDAQVLQLLIDHVMKYKLTDILLIPNFFGNTCLMSAVCDSADPDCVDVLLKSDLDLDIDHVNIYGRTALLHACFHKSRKIVQLLLEHNPPPLIDIRDKGEKTSLFWAADRGLALACASMMILGGDPSLMSAARKSAFDVASGYADQVLNGAELKSARKYWAALGGSALVSDYHFPPSVLFVIVDYADGVPFFRVPKKKDDSGKKKGKRKK